ncbi:CHASE2 domain-containing protein [Pontixanthobacter aquaemixtae]|uniref:CHASE2 domain-containing protein n=1 Tax=Pontixanthobacter aquaemixtae TaxID=1958940 RepID=UPI001368C7F2|nr:CHASE2 domain-containing protein [Pontixanthobacter aquaemixtae]
MLAIWSLHAGVTDRIDTRILDSSTALAGPSASEDIVIVAIDDRSLAALGPWPWSRDVHARLVEAMSEDGARQIIYDVLFLEPTDPEADRRFADSIERAGNVILPHTFGVTSDSGDIGPVYPLAELVGGARGVGHVSTEPDPDGVLRRFALYIGDGDKAYPQLTVAAVQSLSGPAGQDAVAVPEAAEKWPVIPMSPAGSFSTASASSVVDGSLPPGFLSDKIVIIGATAQGMGDRYSVAAGQITLMPGVETQANLLNTLRGGGFISETGIWWAAALACLLIVLQFLAFWKLPPRTNLIATLVLIAVTLLGSVAAVHLAKSWIPPGPIVLAMILAYPLWSWRRLTSVSNFLETEALALTGHADNQAGSGGFDVVARQVGRMKSLVRNVNSSFEFLHQIIEAAPDPIFVLNRDGKVDMWNDKAAKLFPEWDLSQEPVFAEFFMGGAASIDHKAGEVSSADGRTFLMASGALSDISKSAAEGEFADGDVVVLRDISQQRRQETDRREMLEFLSHDMRTPQVAIVGLTQKSAEQIKGDERLERIRLQAQRTLKLADDFVQLARLEETELIFEDTDLVSLAQESCDRAFTATRKHGVTLEQPDQDEPVYAQVEASLIARMLDNLIGNAIKFSPSGAVVVIRVAQDQDDKVVLEVSDEGPGLPPERQADPFARFGAHNTKAGPSVGLGLTFVQRAVMKHGGEIKVRSGPDTGTCFRISLPVKQS